MDNNSPKPQIMPSPLPDLSLPPLFASCYNSLPPFVDDDHWESRLKRIANMSNYHIVNNRIHDVFLSFRGEDTRASFTSHLYASLRNAGITVFKDDESLPRGESISPSLLRAIEQSQISVVVFSRNYAESRWCLKELEKIMECHRTIGQVVVPVFYDVDPSEVRHQTGEFGKGFQNLENRIGREYEEALLRWKEQLRKNNGFSKSNIEAMSSSISTRKAHILQQLWNSNMLIEDDWTEESKVNNALYDAFDEVARIEKEKYKERWDWRDALREAAGISGVVVLNSREQKLLRD